MRILHIVPGLNEKWNGIAVATKLIAAKQSESGAEVEIVDTRDFVHSNIRTFEHYSEIWVHSMWLLQTMCACWRVIRAGKKLVRMPHANLDPLRYRYHGWKKQLVAPIERWLFKRTDRVVVTCAAEKTWCQEWGLKNEFEMVDLKKYFDLNGRGRCPQRPATDGKSPRSVHLLYLGRRHPLKGVEFLGRAVEELKQTFEHSEHSNNRTLELRIVSNAFGEEKEKVWQWCDVLVLPTLSENFGLVVAEALERGKRVITTDGAPAWAPPEAVQSKSGVEQWRGRLLYLKGFRAGTNEERVRLLKYALERLLA